MSIAIFKEVTTEEALQALEAEGEKYTGLFVDMDNPEERKYVKDAASEIGGMLKTLDRARIDKARDFKMAIELEAKEIKGRLLVANEPYTLLIDAHNEKRAEILAKKKAREDAAELLLKIAEDHDSAIMEDKVRQLEKVEADRLQKDRDDKIAADATALAKLEHEAALALAEAQRVQAIKDAEDKAEREARAKDDARIADEKRVQEEQAAREANKEHCRKVNNEILADLVSSLDISDEAAMQIIKVIVTGKIANTKITY